MESKKNRKISQLYLQVSLAFVFVLVIFAAITIGIFIKSARNYSIEVNQTLNRNLAKNMMDVIKTVFHDGKVNEDAVADILHSMMVINPSIEVYLLDSKGKILSYVAPEKVVKMDRVDLKPVLTFINQADKGIIMGDDPRNPGEEKIFSAAEVIDNGVLTGYIYIVLASQEYISAAQMVIGSYILGLSIRSVVVILIISAVVGLLVIWLITRKLNTIIHGISLFHEGDMSARIQVAGKTELDQIGMVFNSMADKLSGNIRHLKEMDEFRRELISNVSHDLRTPVAAIQGYAETLLMKDENLGRNEKHDFLKIIYSSCENLRRLVGELFELAKLETNQVTINPEPFSIAELVSDIAGKYRMLSQKKGISINTFINKEVPMVEADLFLIDRVLQNLIDNAIKFCGEGDYINIEIHPEDSGKVQISISDSGEGISNDELPYIFERYFKGRKYGESSGLGLAIVKKIIDLHQSIIGVQSIPGKGTKFYFSLRRAGAA